MFGLTFFISIATFQSIAGFSNMKPLALFILYILFPVVCAFVYLVSQLLLVFKTLDDRWPLGDLAFGAAFWGIGVTILVVFSADICDTIKHYIDGVFFFHSCMLLAVMMVYKYWDSITVSNRHLYLYLSSFLLLPCDLLIRLCFPNSAKTSSSQSGAKPLSGRSRTPS